MISCGSRCTSPMRQSPSSSLKTSTVSSDGWGIRGGVSHARRPRCSSRKPTTCASMTYRTHRKIWFWYAPKRYCTSALRVKIFPFLELGVYGTSTKKRRECGGSCTSLGSAVLTHLSFLWMDVRFMDTDTVTVMPRCVCLCMLKR